MFTQKEHHFSLQLILLFCLIQIPILDQQIEQLKIWGHILQEVENYNFFSSHFLDHPFLMFLFSMQVMMLLLFYNLLYMFLGQELYYFQVIQMKDLIFQIMFYLNYLSLLLFNDLLNIIQVLALLILLLMFMVFVFLIQI